MPEMQEYIQEFINRKAEEEEALLNEVKIFDMEVCTLWNYEVIMT